MIRVIRDADIPVLASLFLSERQRTFHWVEPSLFLLNDFCEQTFGEQIWVAETAGSPCGFVSIWTQESFVHHLYVSTSCRGQGIGRALLEKGLADLNKPASLKVSSLNTAALDFYHHLGWIDTDDKGLCEITGPWQRMVLSG